MNIILLVKGQKSTATNFYESRYKESYLIIHTLHTNCVCNTVITEGKFILDTKPLTSNKNNERLQNTSYEKIFPLPYFRKRGIALHLLFDNPGQLDKNPKVFEQNKCDTKAPSTDHILCWVFLEEVEIRANWSNYHSKA